MPVMRTSHVTLCDKVRNKIETDFKKGIHLEEFADGTIMTLKKLRKGFKQIYGCTPHQYLLHVRMEKAKLLLEENELLVKAIGYEVGYKSLNTFIRMFVQTQHCTPLQYRNKCVDVAQGY